MPLDPSLTDTQGNDVLHSLHRRLLMTSMCAECGLTGTYSMNNTVTQFRQTNTKKKEILSEWNRCFYISNYQVFVSLTKESYTDDHGDAVNNMRQLYLHFRNVQCLKQKLADGFPRYEIRCKSRHLDKRKIFI